MIGDDPLGAGDCGALLDEIIEAQYPKALTGDHRAADVVCQAIAAKATTLGLL